MSKSYEDCLGIISSLPAPRNFGAIEVVWLGASDGVGVARGVGGRLEIFISGTPIRSSIRLVNEVIEHRVWHRGDGSSFAGNRLALSPLQHFDSVGAVVCAEYIKALSCGSRDWAFHQVAPIIELAIQRANIDSQSLVGLVGELFVLDGLLRVANDSDLGRILRGWEGWRQSSRDLHWQGVGLEVKTTLNDSSIHPIEGVHQVEVGAADGEELLEGEAMLVSVGIKLSDGDFYSVSVPGLCESIIGRLESAGVDDGVVDYFLGRVKEYGSASGSGYDHRRDVDSQFYGRGFNVMFVRGYDLRACSDGFMRSADVLEKRYVVNGSVAYRIALPDVVTVDNPVNGIIAIARKVLSGS